jgi:hypothetical protein
VPPAELAAIIATAVVIARQKGCQGSEEELRRRLAERLFAELRAETRLEPHR